MLRKMPIPFTTVFMGVMLLGIVLSRIIIDGADSALTSTAEGIKQIRNLHKHT